jgi:uncharacterized repeat protein (TIGR04042 family)
MPELHFRIRWPDSSIAAYYSPSTSIRTQLQAGETYPLPEFLERARIAMHTASERVRQKHGYTCSSALDTLTQIETTAENFASQQEASVTVIDVG